MVVEVVMDVGAAVGAIWFGWSNKAMKGTAVTD